MYLQKTTLILTVGLVSGSQSHFITSRYFLVNFRYITHNISLITTVKYTVLINFTALNVTGMLRYGRLASWCHMIWHTHIFRVIGIILIKPVPEAHSFRFRVRSKSEVSSDVKIVYMRCIIHRQPFKVDYRLVVYWRRRVSVNVLLCL